MRQGSPGGTGKIIFIGSAGLHGTGRLVMRSIESLYRKEEGKILIEIKLGSIPQLFNTFDPAPFYEKELDRDAETYIVDTVNDFHAKTQFKIVIYLPPEAAASEQGQKIGEAVHNHFAYRTLVMERKLRNRIRYGRFTLLLGLSFLLVSLVAGSYLLSVSNTLVTQLAADALLITGWAAMWEPVTVLLYQLWPILKTRNQYRKISAMEIDVRPSPK
jgi:hypothetical protein